MADGSETRIISTEIASGIPRVVTGFMLLRQDPSAQSFNGAGCSRGRPLERSLETCLVGAPRGHPQRSQNFDA